MLAFDLRFPLTHKAKFRAFHSFQYHFFAIIWNWVANKCYHLWAPNKWYHLSFNNTVYSYQLSTFQWRLVDLRNVSLVWTCTFVLLMKENFDPTVYFWPHTPPISHAWHRLSERADGAAVLRGARGRVHERLPTRAALRRVPAVPALLGQPGPRPPARELRPIDGHPACRHQPVPTARPALHIRLVSQHGMPKSKRNISPCSYMSDFSVNLYVHYIGRTGRPKRRKIPGLLAISYQMTRNCATLIGPVRWLALRELMNSLLPGFT